MIEWIRNAFQHNSLVVAVLALATLAGGVGWVHSTLKGSSADRRRNAVALLLTVATLLVWSYVFPAHEQLGGTSKGGRTAPATLEERMLFKEGLDLAEQRQFGAALERFKAVEALNPNFPMIHVNEGVMLKELGDCGAAISDIQRDAIHEPHAWVLEYNLASASTFCGNSSNGLHLLAAAARDGFSNCETLRKDSDWDSVRDSPEFRATLSAVCENTPRPR